MDTEVFILRILRARSTRVLQYHHFMILVIFASSNLDGDSASPYPRFPAIFSKNRNGILASQGNFKIVYISCGDEVRDYVFEKNFEKMLYKTFSKFGYIEGSFLSFFSNSIYSFLKKSQNAIFQQMGRS